MANLIRSAKSGSDWAAHDLDAFRVEVNLEDAHTFFGVGNVADLPTPPNISPAIWNNAKAPTDERLSKTDRHFFGYLEVAMREPSEKASVNDFTIFILGLMDYDCSPRFLQTRHDMPFRVCGTEVHAKADVIISERRGDSGVRYVLFVQGYKVRF